MKSFFTLKNFCFKWSFFFHQVQFTLQKNLNIAWYLDSHAKFQRELTLGIDSTAATWNITSNEIILLQIELEECSEPLDLITRPDYTRYSSEMRYENNPNVHHEHQRYSHSNEPNVITIEISTDPSSRVTLSTNQNCSEKKSSVFTIESLIRSKESQIKSETQWMSLFDHTFVHQIILCSF